MSSPFNRSKTRGAFGAPKTNKFTRAVPAIKERIKKHAKTLRAVSANAAKPEFNISDALIDFARPVISQAGNNHTALRGAMNVAILVWNALIKGEKEVDAARKKLLLLPGSSETQIDEVLELLRERKQEKYANVKQLVNKYELRFGKRGARIFISSVNLAPEGIEKTDLANMLAGAPMPRVASPDAGGLQTTNADADGLQPVHSVADFAATTAVTNSIFGQTAEAAAGTEATGTAAE